MVDSCDQDLISLSLLIAGTKLKKANTLAELVVARKALYSTANDLDDLIDKMAQEQFDATL